jgi:hypothetical protein
MTKPIFGGPRILIIDGNLGRIEYVEYFLLRNWFQPEVLPVGQVEQEAGKREVDLVLTYVPIEPKQFTQRGIPVLFMIPEGSSAQKYADSNNPMVACLPTSDGPEALVEKINGLIDR